MHEKYYYILGTILVVSILLPLGYQVGLQSKTFNLENPDYRNHITGFNLEGSEAGNYTYLVEIANPHENMSIRVYSFLFTDPEELKGYVFFNCSVRNGTLFQPLKVVKAIFTLSVSENPFAEGEFYVRVGCLRQGIDY